MSKIRFAIAFSVWFIIAGGWLEFLFLLIYRGSSLGFLHYLQMSWTKSKWTSRESATFTFAFKVHYFLYLCKAFYLSFYFLAWNIPSPPFLYTHGWPFLNIKVLQECKDCMEIDISLWYGTHFIYKLDGIIKQRWRNRWVKRLYVEYNKWTVNFTLYVLNHFIIEDELFNWLTWIVDIIFLFIWSNIVLQILPIFIFVGRIGLKDRLVWKFCLWSLIVKYTSFLSSWSTLLLTDNVSAIFFELRINLSILCVVVFFTCFCNIFCQIFIMILFFPFICFAFCLLVI